MFGDKKYRIIKKIRKAIEKKDILTLDRYVSDKCVFIGYGEKVGSKENFLDFVSNNKIKPCKKKVTPMYRDENLYKLRIKCYYKVAKKLGISGYVHWYNVYGFDKGEIIYTKIMGYKSCLNLSDREKWNLYIDWVKQKFTSSEVSDICYEISTAEEYLKQKKN